MPTIQMNTAIRAEDTVHSVLQRMNRRVFERTPAAVAAVRDTYDWDVRLLLSNRLRATSRRGGDCVEARIESFKRQQPYTIVAGERRIDCLEVKHHGAGMTLAAHYEFELREGSQARGSVHYLPNRDFVLTSRETCSSLYVIAFEGATYTMYKSDTRESWWKASPYAVTLDAQSTPVALTATAPSLLLPRWYLKDHGINSHALLGVLMACVHGLVFNRSG